MISIIHQNNNLIYLNNNKYSFSTAGPTLLRLNEEIDKSTGTYQISFENLAVLN
jgi:hypothetical protein